MWWINPVWQPSIHPTARSFPSSHLERRAGTRGMRKLVDQDKDREIAHQLLW